VNATFAERKGQELYVYVRGVLVMKRWLDKGISVTFYEAGHPRQSTLGCTPDARVVGQGT
jgi:hypothetical protein